MCILIKLGTDKSTSRMQGVLGIGAYNGHQNDILEITRNRVMYLHCSWLV